ncbi:MAG: hypothetical protein ACTSU5_01055 [Promethearchaeota archaeon]
MISAIFLIDEVTGLSFLSKKYSPEIEYREDLITGYLKAIQSLLQTSFGRGPGVGSVRSIHFDRHRILYNQKGRLLVVAISDGDGVESEERTFLNQVCEDFYASYHRQIESFNGDVTGFFSFRERLRQYRGLSRVVGRAISPQLGGAGLLRQVDEFTTHTPATLPKGPNL